jgi:hypothetical protein
MVNPLLRSYGPWGSGAHVSYPYGRLVNDGLWLLPDCAYLLDAKGNVRERDAPAGFTPDVLATFEREPELIDVVALHLLEHHFAPSLHEEILEAVGLELGTPIATRRRDMAFRAAVLKAYLAECCVCGFSLRLVDGLIGVDAAHIRWHAADPTRCPMGWLCAPCTIACSTMGRSRCASIYGCGSPVCWREARLAICSRSLMAKSCGCPWTNSSTRAASTYAGTTLRFSRGRCDGGRNLPGRATLAVTKVSREVRTLLGADAPAPAIRRFAFRASSVGGVGYCRYAGAHPAHTNLRPMSTPLGEKRLAMSRPCRFRSTTSQRTLTPAMRRAEVSATVTCAVASGGFEAVEIESVMSASARCAAQLHRSRAYHVAHKGWCWMALVPRDHPPRRTRPCFSCELAPALVRERHFAAVAAAQPRGQAARPDSRSSPA